MEGKIKAVSQKILSVLIQYPAVLFMSLLMVSSIIYSLEFEYSTYKPFLPARLIIVSSLGISLMFGIKMLSQRIGKSLLLHGLGLLVLVLYFLISPSTKEEFTDAYVFVIFPSLLLSHLFVAFAPHFQKDPEISFWQYNKNLFINFFLTVIFTGVLTGGVMLAILAVQELFSVDFDDRIYPETFFTLAIFGSTFIFLLFNEKGLGQLERDESYPVVLKFFTQFVLIPLLLIYIVILYFYSGKILIKWQLPEGWVSYLILAYSILGILALLLVHPLKDDSAKSWVRIFSKAFYLALMPLLILLFTAIFTRLLDYGFTEPRYFVLLMAIWLLIIVCYFTFIRKSTIKFIPISLFTLGLLALVFPYVNVFSTSIRSQEHELELVLKDKSLLENGKIDFKKSVSSETASNVADKFEYLSERQQHDFLKKFIDSSFVDYHKKDKWYIRSLFQNIVADTNDNRNNYESLYAKETVTKISDYDYMASSEELNYQEILINGDRFTLKSNAKGTQQRFTTLTLNGKEKVDFLPQISDFFKKYPASENAPEVDSLHAQFDLGNYHVKIIFSSINRKVTKKQTDYWYSDALFLIREKRSVDN
ncbi:DUF4153 domain-containing protein [Flavobacterium silvaticum]|uniref:DUF4153 domain-containing protein n=1 Tax=Flavobacterium silvaticum TaxID=1852020 RepID=A0A972JJC5_9FLAO|nr:DUF4153 domain-containing protein [Flavobacterium silvaticum]NMH29218.1 DUF4153 domain-containing protein [Flavobacterium silvaticum]